MQSTLRLAKDDTVKVALNFANAADAADAAVRNMIADEVDKSTDLDPVTELYVEAKKEEGEETPMSRTIMDLSELLQKHDQGDLPRGIAEAVLQLIMEAEVDGTIGAGCHERNGDRTTWRNGYRDRSTPVRAR